MTTIVEELVRKKCTPCEGGVAPLTDAQVAPLLKGLVGWQSDGVKVTKEDTFTNH